MEKGFIDLGISPDILKAIEDMGFENPTEVQSRAIPHILNKEDLIVKSKTGSGKTAVFGVSVLQLTDPAAPGPQGLILTPTRELAVQVDNDIKLLSKHLPHKTTTVYGQHSMNVEIQALKRGVSIVTGTPGRVFDHIDHGTLITKNIRFLVLDEADRMLDMGFLSQVERIIRTIPRNRVTLLFSATIPPEVHKICRDYMRNPVTIEIESQTKTVDTINQIYYRVQPNEKRTQLNRLLLVEQPESCLIFCNTRMAVDRVQSYLSQKGYASEALHGDIPQSKRLKTIQQFKDGDFHILVATDVAARGIHIDDLGLVINYDVPVEKDSYIHRIGRTGRAGNEGRAISLVTSDDIMTLYEIEEHIGAMIAEAELPSEELFAERKAQAGKWLAANTRKPSPNAKPDASSPKASRTLGQASQGSPYQGQARQGPTRHGQTNQGAVQQSQARQGPPRQDPARQGSAQQNPTRQGHAHHTSRPPQASQAAQSSRSAQPSQQPRQAQPSQQSRQAQSSQPAQQSRPAQQPRPPRQPRQDARAVMPTGTQRSLPQNTRSSVYTHDLRTHESPASTRPVETSSSQAAQAKGSFLQRIIKRIFGK